MYIFCNLLEPLGLSRNAAYQEPCWWFLLQPDSHSAACQSYRDNSFRPHHTTPCSHKVINQVLSPPSAQTISSVHFLTWPLFCFSFLLFSFFILLLSCPSLLVPLHLPPRTPLSLTQQPIKRVKETQEHKTHSLINQSWDFTMNTTMNHS